MINFDGGIFVQIPRSIPSPFRTIHFRNRFRRLQVLPDLGEGRKNRTPASFGNDPSS